MEILPVTSPFSGALCYRVGRTGSTQDDARRLAEQWESGLHETPFPPGSVLVAEEQSAGRGRLPGRIWTSAPGESLLFTLRLGAETVSLGGLPLRIGGAVCRAVLGYAAAIGASFPEPPRLKWPNDLMFGRRKACGVLCEAGTLGVFAGIGLNCGQRRFPAELDGRATSLSRELGRGIERWDLLERILAEIRLGLDDRDWKCKVEDLLWKRGEMVVFRPGVASENNQEPEAIEGRLLGIDETGALRLDLGEGRIESFLSGELRIDAISESGELTADGSTR
jgi:BirA family biotin operon repressor/biotin-[acetyl-CoA-carboxylase] ligase